MPTKTRKENEKHKRKTCQCQRRDSRNLQWQKGTKMQRRVELKRERKNSENKGQSGEESESVKLEWRASNF